ncbi:YciI family protein [Embleya sp. NBC_00896]|uniref:YciI family protein n=1 Tax=Embleya sp. NBC_00896 TaxID=2975961 RepID=UPI00386A6B36|nr:YciI family protein [Embleya sp. NBC_00896]
MFVITLTYAVPVEEIDALMADHLEWLDRHYAAGTLLASGRRVPRTGGVILARAADRAALDAVLAEDPFARAGAAAYDVVEFAPTRTAPGLEGLLPMA